MSGAQPANPVEGIKLGIDFVKQIITISAQLLTFVSGGIYFLVQQHVVVGNAWFWAIGFLLGSIVFGLLSLGGYIGQFRQATLDVNSGWGRRFALAQVVCFLAALGCVVNGAFAGIGSVGTAQQAALGASPGQSPGKS